MLPGIQKLKFPVSSDQLEAGTRPSAYRMNKPVWVIHTKEAISYANHFVTQNSQKPARATFVVLGT